MIGMMKITGSQRSLTLWSDRQGTTLKMLTIKNKYIVSIFVDILKKFDII